MPSNQDTEANRPASSSQPASRRKGGTPNSARLIGQPERPFGAEAHGGASAESSGKSRGPSKLPKPKIDLKALFDYHARKRQERKQERDRSRPRAAAATKRKSPEPKRHRRPLSRAERREIHNKRGFQFPFMQKLYGRKHLTLRTECSFEHEALKGFFNNIKMLKYEDHLEKSLRRMDAADDLENECLESRRHKYLDDEGPLSPIEETNGDDPNESGETEDIGARVVENSCFILSSKILKKKSKKTTKSGSRYRKLGRKAGYNTKQS